MQENKNIQDQVMKKIYTVYAIRKAQVCALLLAITLGILAAVASLISFVDIYKNSMIVVDKGNVFEYLIGALSHARPATLLFTLLFSVSVAIGTYQFGLTLFRILGARRRSKDI